MPPQPVLIAGQWRLANSSGSFRAENPATREQLDEYPISAWADCDEALQAAHAANGEWPEQFAGLRERLDRACGETLAASAGIRGGGRGNGGPVALLRAAAHTPLAQEGLFSLALPLAPATRHR